MVGGVQAGVARRNEIPCPRLEEGNSKGSNELFLFLF